MSRRTMMPRFLAHVLLASAVLMLGTAAAPAQDWPNRVVKVIVPYGPGGVTDVIARLVADRFSRALGQPFIIENRGGAGGTLGTELAVRAAKDGYTLYFTGGPPLTIVPQMQKVTYDPLKDLAPIGMVSVNGMGLAVHPDLPVRTLREFFDYVKARPGQINYSVGGVGSSTQLGPALLTAREGLDMVPVPYQSMPPAITALMSGTVQMFFGNISDVIEPVRNGKIRLLAISTEQRATEFPDVATMSETVPGFTMIGWHGVFAPTGTPQPIIDRLSKTLGTFGRDPDFVRILGNVGIEATYRAPAELTQAIQTDIALYKAALEAVGRIRKNAAK